MADERWMIEGVDVLRNLAYERGQQIARRVGPGGETGEPATWRMCTRWLSTS
jgi:hypothetical protein